MTRAEKAALLAKPLTPIQVAPVVVVPVAKTFEVDGEKIPYETAKPSSVEPLGQTWLDIAKNRD